MGSAAPCARKRMMHYLVRMIKPNLIFSHDWHVQPNCQRSLRAFRLSGALLDRGPDVTPGCPRTCCAHRLCVRLQSPAFLREPFKHIELSSHCQALFIFSPRPFQLIVGGSSSLAKFEQLEGEKLHSKVPRSAKYQRMTSKQRRSH
jgi:hypothetical protein